MRLYIAGPMTGYPQYNFPVFFDAERVLQAQGHEVVNPARMDVEIDGFDARVEDREPPLTRAEYMARDLPEVLKSDAIVLLPGWEKSDGARLEALIAALSDTKVYGINRFGTIITFPAYYIWRTLMGYVTKKFGRIEEVV